MGMSITTAIFKNTNLEDTKKALNLLAQHNSNAEINVDDCQFENGASTLMLFNADAVIDNVDIEFLSKEVADIVLSLYIYDDDFWGYCLYENGNLLDEFNTSPDYFEDISDEECDALKGKPDVISKYFDVNVKDIEKYLVHWTEEMQDEEDLAYEDDEFTYCDCWQMADFMQKLGFPYSFE